MAQRLNTNTSVVDYLKSQGQGSSYNDRATLAGQHGISNYRGSAQQNTSLLNSLRGGGSGSSGGSSARPPAQSGGSTGGGGGGSSQNSASSMYSQSLQQMLNNAQKDSNRAQSQNAQSALNSKNDFAQGTQDLWDKQSDFLNDSNSQLSDFLQQQAESQYDKQESMLGQALDSQLANLEKAYSDAVMRGEMSINEANEMFDKQKKEIEHMAYLDAQSTGLEAESRGIGNSQQMLGLMAGDNARKNSLTRESMSDRDRQILDIKSRIDSITTQKDIDMSSAQAQHDFGLAGARAQIDADLAGQMFGLQNQTNQTLSNNMFNMGMAGLQHNAGLDQQALQQGYTQQNMATQNMHNMQNQAMQNQFQELMQDKDHLNNLEKMGVQHNFDLEKMDVGQRYALEQMAQQFGYDLKKMSKQQQYTLAQMSTQQGYTQQNMATQQGYTQQNMGLQNRYDMQSQLNQFSHDRNMQSQSHNNALSMSQNDYNNKLNFNRESYQDALQWEANKYNKGNTENFIKDNQLMDNFNNAVLESMVRAEAEARAGLEPNNVPEREEKHTGDDWWSRLNRWLNK